MSVLLKLMDSSYTNVSIKARAFYCAGQVAASVGQQPFAPYVRKVSELMTTALRDHQVSVNVKFTFYVSDAASLVTK